MIGFGDALKRFREERGLSLRFGRGFIEQIGGDYVSIFLAALNDVSPAELLAAPIKYANGRDNNWWNEPEETRHL